MITVYHKIQINRDTENRHLMPLSLRYIRELSEAGIDWRGLHVIDAFSLICALRITAAHQYLKHRVQEKMGKMGVKNISNATEADFDAL